MADKLAYKVNTAGTKKLTSWEVFSQLTRINFQKTKAELADVVKPSVRLIAEV